MAENIWPCRTLFTFDITALVSDPKKNYNRTFLRSWCHPRFVASCAGQLNLEWVRFGRLPHDPPDPLWNKWHGPGRSADLHRLPAVFGPSEARFRRQRIGTSCGDPEDQLIADLCRQRLVHTRLRILQCCWPFLKFRSRKPACYCSPFLSGNDVSTCRSLARCSTTKQSELSSAVAFTPSISCSRWRDLHQQWLRRWRRD